MIYVFDITGKLTRKRRKPCTKCGAMEHCDDCWEHVRDWSPFRIWNCLLCRMPQAIFDGGVKPVRCEFCGWDERTETKCMIWDEKTKQFVEYDRRNDED